MALRHVMPSRRLVVRCVVALAGAAVSGCIDLTPGPSGPQVLWRVPGHVSTQPLVVGTQVVVAFQDGRVIAYDGGSGAFKWQRKFLGPFTGLSLVRNGTRIIVPEYELHAVDAQTGALLWTYGGVTGTAGVNTPAVSGDTIFAADQASGVAVALSAVTGEEYWSVDLGEALFTPSLAEGLVLYGTRGFLGGPRMGPYGAGHLIALDRSTGEERWRFPLPDDPALTGSGGSTNGGLVVGDRVIVGGRTGRVYAIRLSDGALLWDEPGGDPAGGWYTHAGLLMNGNAVLVRGDGVVEARSTDDGTVVWQTRISSTDTHAPVLCGVDLCTAFGRVWIVSPDGVIRWAHGGGNTGIGYLSAPAVDVQGRMFIGGVRGNSDDQFFALKPPVTVGATP